MNVADSDKIATGGDRNEPPVAGRAALSNKLSNLMFCKVHKCHGDTSTSSIYEPIGAPEVPHETELDFWGDVTVEQVILQSLQIILPKVRQNIKKNLAR